MNERIESTIFEKNENFFIASDFKILTKLKLKRWNNKRDKCKEANINNDDEYKNINTETFQRSFIKLQKKYRNGV